MITSDLYGELDERAIGQIADRVIAALREDLQAIAAHLSDESVSTEQLTVDQVARRLGVARSTVYAHWRQWGGYKLGPGRKAPIRFDAAVLTVGLGGVRQGSRPRRLPVRRDLIRLAPRLGTRPARLRES
jgi:transposase-like protein